MLFIENQVKQQEYITMPDGEIVFKNLYHKQKEDNTIIGKNWICESYDMKKNAGDKEFIVQLVEKWDTLPEDDKHVISDLLADTLSGDNFKLFLDTAIDAGRVKKVEFESLGCAIYEAYSAYSATRMLQESLQKMLQEKPEKEQ